MMTDSLDPPAPSAGPRPPHHPNLSSTLRPRREAFEYGLLRIPKLIFTDPIQTLAPLKQKLSAQFPTNRVDSASLADVLHISIDHAKLVLDTLWSVLQGDPDDSAGADVLDLVLFLYIQSNKKLLPRPHKDPAAVADVWPPTSAFDGYLSALSPLQLVRSNSHRFMPSQADEEAHQLSYLQKHLGNMISLLAEPSEGEGEESQLLVFKWSYPALIMIKENASLSSSQLRLCCISCINALSSSSALLSTGRLTNEPL